MGAKEAAEPTPRIPIIARAITQHFSRIRGGPNANECEMKRDMKCDLRREMKREMECEMECGKR
jgi:hypothetical protein